MIYVFEDETEKLRLESVNRALFDVQQSTINSLEDGVAVFGTNGRLTLANPRMRALWGFPSDELLPGHHIDRVGRAAAERYPQDAPPVWAEIRQMILDLSATRTDSSGRMNLSDGRTLDLSIVRLPDGQTLLKFADVTARARYQQVLRERNEALASASILRSELDSALAKTGSDAPAPSISREQEVFMSSVQRPAHLDSQWARPVVPDQRPGLSFLIGSSELLEVAYSGRPSDEEYRELSGFRPIINNILDEIISLSAGSNAFPQISTIARQYKAALGLDVTPLSIDQLYAHGIRLANLNLRLSQDAQVGDLPDKPDGLGEALESLLGIHGTMVLTTERGRQLLEAARSYGGAREADLEYKRKALEFSETVANAKRVVTPETGEIILAVNSDLSTGPHPDRSTQIARTANYNLLAAAGRIILIGGMGTIASTSLVTSVPGGAAVSIGVELFNSCWYFILNNEQVLRGLAGAAGAELSWVGPLLDLMSAGKTDYLTRWNPNAGRAIDR